MTSGCESSLPDPLESYHQVYKYLVELGYKCSTNLPARAVKQNKLSPRQGGGFSKASVRRFAQTHKLRRTPAVDTPSDDRPALPVACDMDDGPAAERALSATDAGAETPVSLIFHLFHMVIVLIVTPFAALFLNR